MNIKLLKGTELVGTRRGHYNFHYPDTNQHYHLTEHVEAKMLNWIGTKDYEPLWVPKLKDVFWIHKEKLNAITQRRHRSKST